MPYKDKEKRKEYNREYREKNREYLIEHTKKWKEKNPNYNKEYVKEHKEERQKYNKEYYQKNKKEMNKKSRRWRIKNLERKKGYDKEYRKRNRKKINNYFKNKTKNDDTFRISCNLRGALNRAFRKYTKTGKIMNSRKYGIDYKVIIEYLKPFPKNLSNYQIHHIKPLFTFNFINEDGSTNLDEVKKAFAPKNHKWLTIKEHRNLNHKSYTIKDK